MDQIVLKVKEENWGMHTSGDWASNEWHVYDDGKVKLIESYIVTYGEETKEIEKNFELPLDRVKEISDLLNDAKEFDELDVDACDGTGYEFEFFDEGNLAWRRKMGYIYGIEPLEKIIKLLPEPTYDLL